MNIAIDIDDLLVRYRKPNFTAITPEVTDADTQEEQIEVDENYSSKTIQDDFSYQLQLEETIMPQVRQTYKDYGRFQGIYSPEAESQVKNLEASVYASLINSLDQGKHVFVSTMDYLEDFYRNEGSGIAHKDLYKEAFEKMLRAVPKSVLSQKIDEYDVDGKKTGKQITIDQVLSSDRQTIYRYLANDQVSNALRQAASDLQLQSKQDARKAIENIPRTSVFGNIAQTGLTAGGLALAGNGLVRGGAGLGSWLTKLVSKISYNPDSLSKGAKLAQGICRYTGTGFMKGIAGRLAAGLGTGFLPALGGGLIGGAAVAFTWIALPIIATYLISEVMDEVSDAYQVATLGQVEQPGDGNAIGDWIGGVFRSWKNTSFSA